MNEPHHSLRPAVGRARAALGPGRRLRLGPGLRPALGAAIALVAALAAAAAGWRTACALEEDRFEHASGLLLRTAGERIVEMRGVLRSMVGMHYASDEFAGADIEAFAEQLRIHTPFVDSLGVVATVDPELRPDYERYAVSELGRERPVRAWGVDAAGGVARAVAAPVREGAGQLHWVVDSIESPSAESASFVGTDLASVPSLERRLSDTIATGRGFVAPVPTPWPVRGDALLVQPVYLDERAPDDAVERRESLVGAVWVTLDLGDWLDAGREGVGAGLAWALELDGEPVAAGSRPRGGVGVDGRGRDLGFGTASAEREWQLGDSRVRLVASVRLGAPPSSVTGIAAAAALAAAFALAVFGLGTQRRLRGIERAAATRVLAAEREQAHRTLESISDAVVRTDADGMCRFVNPSAVRWFGFDIERDVGRPLADVLRLETTDGGEAVDPLALLRARAAGEGSVDGLRRSASLDVRVPSAPRGDATFGLTLSAVRDGEDARTGALLVLQDVSRERELTAELERRAHTDPLTGCHNRFDFERRLRELVDDAVRSGRRHAFCSIDLDRFKIVNDTCGHPAGDRLLRELGEALRPRVRPQDVLARLGGDEFGILLVDVGPEAVRRVAESVHEHFRTAAFEHEGHVFPVRASIGVVGISGSGADADRVLEAADAACYAAKRGGRDALVLRLDETAAPVEREETRWVPVLERALDSDRVGLALRPVARHGARACGGTHAEAQVRLHDEAGNVLERAAWASSAERHGLMPRIERRAIRLVLDAFAAPGGRAAPDTLAFAVSGPTLDEDDFAPWLEAELAARDLAGVCLRLLIAEDVVLARFAPCAALATRLARSGVRCTLDRFGAELSSLAALAELPFDAVRLDRRWARGLGGDARVRAALEALCAFARAASLTTIVDGIDDARALAALAGVDADFAQGNAVGEAHAAPPADTRAGMLARAA